MTVSNTPDNLNTAWKGLRASNYAGLPPELRASQRDALFWLQSNKHVLLCVGTGWYNHWNFLKIWSLSWIKYYLKPFLVSLTCLFPKRQSLGAADQHTLLWNLWVFNSHKLSSAPFETFYLRLLPGTVSLCVFPLVAIEQQAQEVAFQVHVITDSHLKVC